MFRISKCSSSGRLVHAGRQWRTQEFCSKGERGDSTNSVEDRGQRERGSGGGSPLFRGSAQFAIRFDFVKLSGCRGLLRIYFPRNWEFGSDLSKLRNLGGVLNPQPPSVRRLSFVKTSEFGGVEHPPPLCTPLPVDQTAYMDAWKKYHKTACTSLPDDEHLGVRNMSKII
jgi:hypothetical protein